MSKDSTKLVGRIVADEIEVRFPFSGKVVIVKKKIGDEVKKGDILAILDNKILQMELDVQLANYEQRRAEFEIFNKKNTGGDDFTMYARRVEQAQLNASVREVELTKAKMDQVTLVSPVNGMVLGDGGNRAGINASPASNAFSILDLDSKRFEIITDAWLEQREVVVTINNNKIKGKMGVCRPAGQKLVVDIDLEDYGDLNVGMTGVLYLI